MFTENLTPFFTDFATEAKIGSASLSVIFDAPSATGQVGPFGMTSTHPSMSVASDSLPSGAVGMLITHAAVTYRIVEIQDDGAGMSTLILEATS